MSQDFTSHDCAVLRKILKREHNRLPLDWVERLFVRLTILRQELPQLASEIGDVLTDCSSLLASRR